VTDLQKNLFSQIDQYDYIDRKASKNLKSIREIRGGGGKEPAMGWIDPDAPYLKRLEKGRDEGIQSCRKLT
jgi:hypothetical protein